MKKQLVPPHACDVIQVTPAAAVTSGTWFLYGTLPAVYLDDIAANAKGSCAIAGQYSVTKEGATGQAWAVGDRVYWDDTNDQFTTTSTGNTLAGVAIEAATATATTGKLKLTPQAVA